MPPKRRRDNDHSNDEEQDKITWISEELYRDLNNRRQSGREQLNARLAAYTFLPRPVRTIARPRGEAGRKSATSNGSHRDGFALKDILKRESGVKAEHYAMIQDTVHRLAARYLDIRRTWRENQGEELVRACTEAAKLHPCLYDYDAFWPVHDHLKRHLLSTRNKYKYVDPDLVGLYDAEATVRGDVQPPPRKKRQTVSRQPQPVNRASPPQSLQVPPAQQHPPERFSIKMCSWKTSDEKFLMTLRSDLIAKGHSVRDDLPLRPQVWKILLAVGRCDAVEYNLYVEKGPSTTDSEIKQLVLDLRRLGPYREFLIVVRDTALIRLVNAFAWLCEETKHHNLDNTYGLYVFALVFLYTMPSEAEAFWCLNKFIQKCPAHVQDMGDANQSRKLLDQCLEYLDKELHSYLQSSGHSVDDYADICTQQFSVFFQPANQVVKLWDLLLSHGLHLNMLAIASRMLLAKEDIMDGTDPEDILQLSTTLYAEPVIRCTLEIEQQLPSGLLDELKKSLVELSQDDL